MPPKGYKHHGLHSTPEWQSWKAMRSRCNNPGNVSFYRYGGRGISICSRWDDFKTFLADMGPRPSKNHTLDRIDTDGDYTPANCRWSSSRVQSRNRTSNRLLTHLGRTMTVTDWETELGFPRNTLFNRTKAGWTVEQMLTTPVGVRRRR
jgi:hypothetical protein